MKTLILTLLFLIVSNLCVAQTSRDIATNSEQTFSFYAKTDTTILQALFGDIKWDSTKFHFVSFELNEGLSPAVVNLMDDRIRFSWASAAPTVIDSLIITLVLNTKNVIGSYTITGKFQVNESRDTVRVNHSGNIFSPLSFERELPVNVVDVDVYPNPANPDVNFLITTPKPQHVSVKIYDVSGSEVKVIFNKFLYDSVQIRYTVDNIPSGVYYLTLQGSDWRIVKPFTVIK